MTDRHVCSAACNLTEDLQAARRRLGVTRPPAGPVVDWVGTPLRRILRRKPGRCPCCAHHIGAQGHAPGCLFGPRANLALAPDGSWIRNP